MATRTSASLLSRYANVYGWADTAVMFPTTVGVLRTVCTFVTSTCIGIWFMPG